MTHPDVDRLLDLLMDETVLRDGPHVHRRSGDGHSSDRHSSDRHSGDDGIGWIDGLRDHPVASHVRDCTDCAAELRELRRITAAGRAAPQVQRSQPGDGVWQAVATELDLAPSIRPGDRDVATSVSERPPPAWRRPLAVAAAGALIVGLATGAGVTAIAMSDDPVPSENRSPSAVVQAATLTAVDGTDAAAHRLTGAADLVGTGDVLDVRVPGLIEAPGDHYEVWLADDTLGRLVPLGVLHRGAGSFALPPGLDLDDYRVVDVSRERADGDPGHSGDSVVRGSLGA